MKQSIVQTSIPDEVRADDLQVLSLLSVQGVRRDHFKQVPSVVCNGHVLNGRALEVMLELKHEPLLQSVALKI